jgi:hypothetical protein
LDQNADKNKLVQLWWCNGGKNQQWFIHGGKNTNMVDNVDKRNKCLDLTHGNTQNGAIVNIYTCDGYNYNQQWSKIGQTWTKFKGTSFCLTAYPRKAGTKAYIWQCDNSLEQQWTTVPVQSPGPWYFVMDPDLSV